jgi:hypothetical protein
MYTESESESAAIAGTGPITAERNVTTERKPAAILAIVFFLFTSYPPLKFGIIEL